MHSLKYDIFLCQTHLAFVIIGTHYDLCMLHIMDSYNTCRYTMYIGVWV